MKDSEPKATSQKKQNQRRWRIVCRRFEHVGGGSSDQVCARPLRVQATLGLTAPTATLWIRRARAQGLLGNHGDSDG